MVFSSPVFLFAFLPVVLAGYFALPDRARNSWLLAASLLFYGWGSPAELLLMLSAIALNYFAARAIAGCRETPLARVWLAAALSANFGLLGTFKYLGFFSDVLADGAASFGIVLPRTGALPLPIGISFYTFQGASYVIDVARGTAPAERNPLRVALYIALFPQLVAGPIVRYDTIASAMHRRRVTELDLAIGIERFILGLGKKLLIANSVAAVADSVFDLPPERLSTPVAWFGLVCYSLQIYFDFSGYSDMAIGLGRMFGFRFLENFNYPYIAQSLTDFWRRWHLSLSTWFRDYVYIPLGGNRHGMLRTQINLLTVFLLCGLWHGASWNFVLWGAWHGLLLTLERAGWGAIVAQAPRPLRHAYTLLAIMGGWVLFRATTLPAASAFGRALCGLQGPLSNPEPLALYVDPPLLVVLIVALLGSGPVYPRLRANLVAALETGRLPHPSHWLGTAALLALFLLEAVVVSSATYNPFIYFRF